MYGWPASGWVVCLTVLAWSGDLGPGGHAPVLLVGAIVVVLFARVAVALVGLACRPAGWCAAIGRLRTWVRLLGVPRLHDPDAAGRPRPRAPSPDLATSA